MNENLLQLAKAHQIEPFRQAISEIDDFDINVFFDENFMFWSVEDIDFLGSHFDIAVNFNDNACFIKPDILNYFLEKGIKFDTESKRIPDSIRKRPRVHQSENLGG